MTGLLLKADIPRRDLDVRFSQSQHMQRTPKSIDVRFAPKATVSAKMRSAALSHKPTSIFVGAR